jgi:aminoglycoside/choline kinase family phosphotransferase
VTETSRNRLRQAFLARTGLGHAEIRALAPDASFRRYYRIVDGERSLMLMDAPPTHEAVAPYVAIARHLTGLGLKAPLIHDTDAAHGFVLLEDFGDDTYTRLLERGVDERELYALAIDVLCRLHAHPDAATIDLAPYDRTRLLDEALLLADWFYPARFGKRLPEAARDRYAQAWTETLDGLPPMPSTLVLRDFHVDNLMRVTTAGGTACGLLDFQDAVLGPGVYDLVSLLEDARRDIDPVLVSEMKERYLASFNEADRALFESGYAVLGAQRHCKVAGIFVRLCVRDGKCAYLRHIPRVLGLLDRQLRHADLAPLRTWLDTHMPDWRESLLDFDPEHVRTLMRRG